MALQPSAYAGLIHHEEMRMQAPNAVTFAVLIAGAASAPALAQDATPSQPLAGQVVKMVRIDALSGLMGPVGQNQFKGYQYLAEVFSGKGNPAGVRFEVSAIDN